MENDRETALAGLEELLRLAPYETEVRVQYGLALKHAGRLEESLAAFNVAAQRRPGNRQITLNQQHLRQLLRERSSPAETP
jgi:Flp pilus assembly protein TadD